jgi:hypothetical protein
VYVWPDWQSPQRLSQLEFDLGLQHSDYISLSIYVLRPKTT